MNISTILSKKSTPPDYPAYLDEPDKAAIRARKANWQRARRRQQGYELRACYEIKPWEEFGMARRTYFRQTTADERAEDRRRIYNEFVKASQRCQWHTCEDHIISESIQVRESEGYQGRNVEWSESKNYVEPLREGVA